MTLFRKSVIHLITKFFEFMSFPLKGRSCIPDPEIKRKRSRLSSRIRPTLFLTAYDQKSHDPLEIQPPL